MFHPISQQGAKVKLIMSMQRVSRIDNNSLTIPGAAIKGNKIAAGLKQPCKAITRRVPIMRVKKPAKHILPWLYRSLRWSLGSIFIYSGVIKLFDPVTFAVLIDAYGLVPDILLMPLAVIIPLFEVLAGAGLMVDLRGSLGGITGLLLLFVAILGFGIRMGLDVDCGCFGPEDPEAEAFHGLRTALYRDMIMLAGVFFLYWWRQHNKVVPVRLSMILGKFHQTEEAHG